VRLDGVQQLVGDRLDPRAQLLDHLRRERLRHEPPQAPVVVAVAIEHVVLDRAERREEVAPRLELLGGQRVARVAHEALVVEQHGRDVVVAGDEPDRGGAVEARLREDRVVRPHAGEDRVGIGAEGGAVEVVLALGDRHRPSVEPLTR
jgi:hypothetical protein